MSERSGRGLILAAPASGSGKTTVTLGLLRALARDGITVRGAKSGPDYIDPAFHAAACGAPCSNLDAFAMTPAMLAARAAGPGLLLVEGAMGLFDGAPADAAGSTAELARTLGLPVLLVVDVARMAQSVAPLVAGFARHDPQVRIAGVILNRVGSDRHAALLRAALAPLGLPVLGALPRDPDLAAPERHLGLVQAAEHADLTQFLDTAAAVVRRHLDLHALVGLASPLPPGGRISAPPPPAQTVAIAADTAFGFAYPHHLHEWRAAGAELKLFSPLADAPVPEAGFVYLPGGYPELHAGAIAAAGRFLHSLRSRAQAGVPIYGECGGFMVLGDGLVDADGRRHQMAGLLRLETSFAARRLHLGYRRLETDWPPIAGRWRGHEFHYATTLKAEGAALFAVSDAGASTLPDQGLHAGSAAGSFCHLIDRAG